MRRFAVLAMLWSVTALSAEPNPTTSPSDTRGTTESVKASPAAVDPAEVRETPTTAAEASRERAAASSSRATADRLNLDTTVVTGNRELPKVLYIVPWKKADIGDLPGQPFNTLVDEVLTPVDRDVFRREVTYYGAIAADGQPDGAVERAPADQAPRSEK